MLSRMHENLHRNITAALIEVQGVWDVMMRRVHHLLVWNVESAESSGHTMSFNLCILVKSGFRACVWCPDAFTKTRVLDSYQQFQTALWNTHGVLFIYII